MGQSGVILLAKPVVLWLACEPSWVSKRASRAIEDARKNEGGLAISDITLLEIATLARKGRIHLGSTLESCLQEVEVRFLVLPISGLACARSVELPTAYLDDPADRIIGATALVQGIPLLTADEKIRQSRAVQTIW